MTKTAAALSDLVQVAEDYKHYSKEVVPADDLIVPGVHLKWYDIRRPEATVAEQVHTEARDFLLSEIGSRRLDLYGELGFVLLHLCGESFFFLIVCTWRNNNEMWETVYFKDGEVFQLLPRERTHKETLCVWELGAVWHEQQAWTRYLYSARDDRARLDYIADRFSGSV